MEIQVQTSGSFQQDWETASASIKHQMASRGHRAANELRNASQIILRGQRSGRRYKVPGTYRRQRDKTTGRMRSGRYYTASAPGEPPAVRTGTFRAGWHPITYAGGGTGNYHVVSKIRNTTKTDNGRYMLATILEEGTSKMAPRPHHEKIQEKALPKIKRIYSEPYTM